MSKINKSLFECSLHFPDLIIDNLSLQEELDNHLQISRQAVSKWESGQSMPDTDKIIQLSQLFHVTTDYPKKTSINIMITKPLKTPKVPT